MAEQAPDLHIPDSQETVKLSIINSTAYLTLPVELLVKPPIGDQTTIRCPSYSFLIEHSSGRKVLFDLGVRKDWENLAPKIVNNIKDHGWGVEIEKNVADILTDNNVTLSSIEAIIWSHYHLDHSGDPTTFPGSVDLIVGPGFKDAFLPGYPGVKDSPVLETDWKGRNLKEMSFDGKLMVGKYEAIDFFGDGSFYLLNSTGHAIGHMAGLARTTASPPSFVFLGGDTCHHAGEFRPTKYIPLPKEVSPSPSPKIPAPCPGDLLLKIHPKHSATEPYYETSPDFNHDMELALQAARKMEEFDAADNVFVAIAHDAFLMDGLDFYPKRMNDWMEKGAKKSLQWSFLKEYASALEKADK